MFFTIFHTIIVEFLFVGSGGAHKGEMEPDTPCFKMIDKFTYKHVISSFSKTAHHA